MPHRFSLLLCLVMLACNDAPVPETAETLPGVSANSGIRLGRIVGAAELSDGRWLVSDFDEKKVRLVDFTRDTAFDVGKAGPGPGEYLRPAPLWRLGGDSILMVNEFARRWDLFRDGRIDGSIQPIKTPGSGISLDTVGGIVTIRTGPTPQDSQAVIRTMRAGGRQSIVIQLEPPFPGYVNLPPPYMDQWEEAALAPDGWIAIRLTDTYRVDWITPEGVRVHGPPLPVEKVKIDQAEKDYLLSTMSPGRREMVTAESEWPEYVPPVASTPMQISPLGEAVIERAPSSRARGRVYDVVGRDGRLVRQVTLDRAAKIVGFGRKTALIVTEDSDGFFVPSVVVW